jgi:hypothetical protein
MELYEAKTVNCDFRSCWYGLMNHEASRIPVMSAWLLPVANLELRNHFFLLLHLHPHVDSWEMARGGVHLVFGTVLRVQSSRTWDTKFARRCDDYVDELLGLGNLLRPDRPFTSDSVFILLCIIRLSPPAHYFSPEDGSSALLRNVGFYQPVHRVPKPRTTSSQALRMTMLGNTALLIFKRKIMNVSYSVLFQHSPVLN